MVMRDEHVASELLELPGVNSEQVDTIARFRTQPQQPTYVTTILDITAKPALGPRYAKEKRRYLDIERRPVGRVDPGRARMGPPPECDGMRCCSSRLHPCI
jgi:hypothetical protein